MSTTNMHKGRENSVYVHTTCDAVVQFYIATRSQTCREENLLHLKNLVCIDLRSLSSLFSLLLQHIDRLDLPLQQHNRSTFFRSQFSHAF